MDSEHPYCDTIQIVVIVLFFGVWFIDSLSYFFFTFSTVLVGLMLLQLRILLFIISIIFSLYLVAKSHKEVLSEIKDELVDTGVYSLVRHPMYLGTLLFCLAFFFVMPSLLSLMIWIGFFIFYDKMATYEENNLIRIFGEKYIAYKKRVSKWFPRVG